MSGGKIHLGHRFQIEYVDGLLGSRDELTGEPDVSYSSVGILTLWPRRSAVRPSHVGEQRASRQESQESTTAFNPIDYLSHSFTSLSRDRCYEFYSSIFADALMSREELPKMISKVPGSTIQDFVFSS